MKIISKPSRDIAVSACSLLSLGIMLISPAATFALDKPQNDGAHSAAPKTSDFCTKLASDQGKYTSELNGRVAKASDALQGRNEKWSTVWANVDSKVTEDRQKADTERQADFAKLQAKATTSSEQQAVQAYETAVNNAVSTRRAAYDSAREAFRNGVETIVSGRQSTIAGQLNSFETAVNTAFQNAQASCASNPSDGPAIRATLMAALKSARENYTSDRKGDATVGSQIQQLIATRDAAFKAANQTFQNSMTAAAQTLKAAFGGKSGSV